MKPSLFLHLVALVGIFGSQRAWTSEAVKRPDRPNLVFLMADDQCTYSLGCYGTPGVRTPQLDALARDGIVFDRHYDTTAICMAVRARRSTRLEKIVR